MAAENKTIVLVTGANSGVGFALAGLLLADASKHVLLGSRSREKGDAAVQDLQSQKLPGSVELLVIDVTSEKSIHEAAEFVEDKYGRLDGLVNNAAVGGLKAGPDALASTMALSFQTNATAPLLTVEAFAPLLRKSSGTPRIINVSSGAGSLTKRVANGADYGFGIKGLAYSSSKAALNLITVAQSKIYGEEGWKVFVYTPGFCVSNLGEHNKAENGARPADEGAAPMVKMLDGERDGEHGGFLSSDGQYPW